MRTSYIGTFHDKYFNYLYNTVKAMPQIQSQMLVLQFHVDHHEGG